MKIPNPLEYPLYSAAALIFAVAMGYQLFQLIDGQFLSRRETETKVIGHEYRPVSKGTQTTQVGNTVRSYPITLPDAYLLLVEIDGLRGKAEVPHIDYAAIKDGDPVRVVYSRRRIRKSLTVHEIHKLGEGR